MAMIDWSIGVLIRGRPVLFRLVGILFVVWASAAMLFSLLMLGMSFLGSRSGRVGSLLEAVALLAVSFLVMLLGIRLVSVTAQDISEGPSRLAALRDRFERWVNREDKNV
jgi:hypothetical protein